MTESTASTDSWSWTADDSVDPSPREERAEEVVAAEAEVVAEADQGVKECPGNSLELFGSLRLEGLRFER